MKDRRQNYSTDYACIFGVFEQMKNQLIKLTDAFQIGKEISRMGNQIGSRDHHGKLIIQGCWLKIRGLVHVFQGASIFTVAVLMMKVTFFVTGLGYKTEVRKSTILGSSHRTIDDLFQSSQFFYHGVISRPIACQVRACHFGEFCTF